MIDLNNSEQIKKVSDMISKLVKDNEFTLNSEGITDEWELACIYSIISQKYNKLYEELMKIAKSKDSISDVSDNSDKDVTDDSK